MCNVAADERPSLVFTVSPVLAMLSKFDQSERLFTVGAENYLEGRVRRPSHNDVCRILDESRC
jgi:hypothetical protein